MTTNEFIFNMSSKIMRFLQSLLLLFVLLIVQGCDDPDKLGAVTGRVILNNDISHMGIIDDGDYSNIKVSLYLPVLTDSTVHRLSMQYGNLGVDWNIAEFFDHRDMQPIYTGLTNEGGVFSFEDVKPGSYLFVCERDLWGTVYKHGVTIPNSGIGGFHADKKEVTDIGTVFMYPARVLNSVIADEFLFEKDRTYIINGDTQFTNHAVFSGGSRIVLYPGTGISFLGEVTCNPDASRSLFYAFLDNAQSDGERWSSLKLYNDNQAISNWVLSGAETGIIAYGSGTSITNSYFDNMINGVYVQGENSIVSKNIFSDIIDRCFALNQSAGSEQISHVFHRNIISRAGIGLRTNGQSVSILKNYFIDCGEAVISFQGFHELEGNSFDRCGNAIVCNGTQIDIKKNSFHDNINSIQFTRAYYASTSNPLIVYNNFYQTHGYAIKLNPWTTSNDIEAKNNYWLSNDIPSVIYDVNDFSALEHEVTFMPKSNTPFPDAGAD